jgi:hypothetical protein
MCQLLFILSLLFVVVISPLALDHYCTGCISGRGLLGSFAGTALVTWWAVIRAHKKLPRLGERGEADGDLTNWLLAVCVVAILLFLVTGRCAAALCLWNPPTPEAVWQNQHQVEDNLKGFTVSPRASSFPLPKPKVVSAPIPSMAGLLACGLFGLLVIRRRGGAR